MLPAHGEPVARLAAVHIIYYILTQSYITE